MKKDVQVLYEGAGTVYRELGRTPADLEKLISESKEKTYLLISYDQEQLPIKSSSYYKETVDFILSGINHSENSRSGYESNVIDKNKMCDFILDYFTDIIKVVRTNDQSILNNYNNIIENFERAENWPLWERYRGKKSELIKECFPKQQILYGLEEGFYKEIGRDTEVDWITKSTEVLEGDEKYLAVTVPARLKEEGNFGITSIIEGTKKEFAVNEIKEILADPHSSMWLLDTNEKKWFKFYNEKIEDTRFLLQEDMGFEGAHEYFENAECLLLEGRDQLVKNSFPEMGKFVEVSEIAVKIIDRLTGLQRKFVNNPDDFSTLSRIAYNKNSQETEIFSSKISKELEEFRKAIEKQDIDGLISGIKKHANQPNVTRRQIQILSTSEMKDNGVFSTLEPYFAATDFFKELNIKGPKDLFTVKSIDQTDAHFLLAEHYKKELQATLNYAYQARDEIMNGHPAVTGYYDGLGGLGEERKGQDLKKNYKQIEALQEDIETLRTLYPSDEKEISVELLAERSKNFLNKVEDLQSKASLLKKEGKEIGSSEVKNFMQECDDVLADIETVQKHLKIYADGFVDQETPSFKQGSEKIQVVVVNDKGFYKELAVESDNEKFLSPLEVEKFAEGLKTEYPGHKLLVIQIDKAKYLDIKGISSEVAVEKDKLLKAEGDISFDYTIGTLKNEKDQRIPKKKGNNELSKEMDKVAQRDNRYVLDAIDDYLKLISMILGDLLGRVARIFFREKPDTKIESNPEMLQIITVEQSDGSIVELKSESNKNRFIHGHELKAYAEDVAKLNGKFRLIEIPKKDYPNVNDYLDRGVLTTAGKEIYQKVKTEFFKKYAGTGISYQSEKFPEKKPVNNPDKKKDKRNNQKISTDFSNQVKRKKKNGIKR